MTPEVEVLLAVDNETIRRRLAKMFRDADMALVLLGSSAEARHVSLKPSNFIILETNNDAAALVQIVNDLYRSNDTAGRALPIIAIVSRNTISQNPQLGFWCIDGHAAVECVWPTEDIDLHSLPAFVSRFEPDL